MNIKKSALSIALASVISSGVVLADIIDFDYDGLFVLLTPTGSGIVNDSLPYYYDASWGYGVRTQISGSLQLDTVAGTGSATVSPFNFLNAAGQAVVTNFVFKNDANGLMLGNMLFSWKRY